MECCQIHYYYISHIRSSTFHGVKKKKKIISILQNYTGKKKKKIGEERKKERKKETKKERTYSHRRKRLNAHTSGYLINQAGLRSDVGPFANR